MYRKFFTVSFDDGLEQDKMILGLMRKYGIRGTFNLNSSLLGQDADIGYLGKYGVQNLGKNEKRSRLLKYAAADRIPEDEIPEVYRGMELASHGAHHLDESKLSLPQLRAELSDDRKALQRLTDTPVVGHVLPFGKTSAAVTSYMRENGFLYTRGIKSQKAKRNFAFPDDPLLFNPTCWQIEADFEKLVDQFIEAEPVEGDMLFYVWGHGYEFDFPACKGLRESYERVFAKIAEHDEILKCTNAEAFSAHYANH